MNTLKTIPIFMLALLLACSNTNSLKILIRITRQLL